MTQKCRFPKPPRQVVFHDQVFSSINSFYKWTVTQGYTVKFGSIRYALDHDRDLDEVLAGKKFEKKVRGFTITYQSVTYPSYRALYRTLKKKHHFVYLKSEGFRTCAKTHGLETAIERLLHPRVTNTSISRKLGGPENLVTLRLKHGWSYKRATTEKCHKKGKCHAI